VYGGGGSADLKVQVKPFAPGQRTGPVPNFRDGGGPVRDEEGVDLPPPPDRDGDGEDDIPI
jgi:hypothetical protein